MRTLTSHPRIIALVTVLAVATNAAAQNAPARLSVIADSSAIYVVTHRTGLFSFLGHEHAILAPTWTAQLCWDAAEPGASVARIRVDARELVIDTREARRLAGLGDGPSPSQRDKIQTKLLDASHLAVDEHPELSFEATALSEEADRKLRVQGRLTIRGVTRQVEVPVSLDDTGAGMLRLRTVLTVRQSQFGIKPESIAAVVKVADPVDIYVSLLATPAAGDCVVP